MTRDIRLDDITPVGRWIVYKDNRLTDPVVVMFEDLSVSYTSALEQTLGRKPDDKASYSKGIFGELKDGTKVIVANVINPDVDPDQYKDELGKFFYEHPEVSDNILETPFLRVYEVKPKMEKEAKLVRRYNKKRKRTEWALVSRSNPKKVLRWFGPRKPSEERVLSEERRVQWFKHKGSVRSAWLVEEISVIERKDGHSFTKDDIELKRKWKWLTGPKDKLERKDIFGPHTDTEFGSGLLKKDKELYPWWEFTETPQFREKYAYFELPPLPEEPEEESEEETEFQKVPKSVPKVETVSVAPVTTNVEEIIRKLKTYANQLKGIIVVFNELARAFAYVKKFYNDMVTGNVKLISLVDRKLTAGQQIDSAIKKFDEFKSKLGGGTDYKKYFEDLFENMYEAYKGLLEISNAVREQRAELTREMQEDVKKYQEEMYSGRLTRLLTQETSQKMFEQKMEEFRSREKLLEDVRAVLNRFRELFRSLWDKLGTLYNLLADETYLIEFLKEFKEFLSQRNFAVSELGYQQIVNELKSKFGSVIQGLSEKVHKIDPESFVRLVNEFSVMVENELPQVIPSFEKLERIPVKRASLTKTSAVDKAQDSPLYYNKEGAQLEDPSLYLERVKTLPDLLGAYIIYEKMSDDETVSGPEKFEKFFEEVEKRGLPSSGLDEILRDSPSRSVFAKFLVDYSKRKKDIQKIKEFFVSQTYSPKTVQYLSELYKAVEHIDYGSEILNVIKEIIESFVLPAEELPEIPETESFIKDTLFFVIDAAFDSEKVKDILKKAIKNYLITKFYEKVEKSYKETEIGEPIVDLLIEFLNEKYSGQIGRTFDEFKRSSLDETIEAIRKKYPSLTSALNVFKSLVGGRVPARVLGAGEAVSNLFDFLTKKHGIDVNKLPARYRTTFEDKSKTIMDILAGHSYLPRLPKTTVPTEEIDLSPIYDKFAGVLKQLYRMSRPFSQYLNIYLTRQDFKDRVMAHIRTLVGIVSSDVSEELSKDIESLGDAGKEIFNEVVENCVKYFTDKIYRTFLEIV